MRLTRQRAASLTAIFLIIGVSFWVIAIRDAVVTPGAETTIKLAVTTAGVAYLFAVARHFDRTS
jgi:hypothetical protein